VLPSALLWLIRYLDSGSSTPVMGEVPRNRPSKFVRVSLAGGNDRTSVTSAPQLLVESWGATILEAEALSREMDALVRAAPGNVVDVRPEPDDPPQNVYCKGFDAFGLPYESPDPDSGAARFRQLVSLTFRRTE
jgi:hypothetical protein